MTENNQLYKIRWEAQQAYREGLSQEDNPYQGPDRMIWGLEMHRMELEEFHSLMGGSYQCQ